MANTFYRKTRRVMALILLTSTMWMMDCVVHRAQAENPITPTIDPGEFSQDFGTQVLHDGSTTLIGGGTSAGPNLFHSFDTFGVEANGTAVFQNTLGGEFTNVFARVIGQLSPIEGERLGSPSMIDGTIQTNGPGGFGNANLWFMNPSGIIFGQNASLDIGGSAIFTTANGMGFGSIEDGEGGTFTPVFDGITNSGELQDFFSVTPVIDFGFLSLPKPIDVKGNTLSVSSGKTLSLVGGNVTISGGSLSAPNGVVRITSVSSAGGLVKLDDGEHVYDPSEGDEVLPTEPGLITIGQGLGGKDAIIDTGSTGTIQLNTVSYTGSTATGSNVIDSKPPIIQITNGSILVANLPNTKLIVSSPAVSSLPPGPRAEFPVNNGSSSQPLTDATTVLTTIMPSPSQLVLASGRCVSGTTGEFSSFVRRGRDASPLPPGGLLASPLIVEDEAPPVSRLSIRSGLLSFSTIGPLKLASGTTTFLTKYGGC